MVVFPVAPVARVTFCFGLRLLRNVSPRRSFVLCFPPPFWAPISCSSVKVSAGDNGVLAPLAQAVCLLFLGPGVRWREVLPWQSVFRSGRPNSSESVAQRASGVLVMHTCRLSSACRLSPPCPLPAVDQLITVSLVTPWTCLIYIYIYTVLRRDF